MITIQTSFDSIGSIEGSGIQSSERKKETVVVAIRSSLAEHSSSNGFNVDGPSVASCESCVSGGGAEVRHGEKNGGIEGLLLMVVASAIRSSLGCRSGHVSAVLVRVGRLFEHVGSLLVQVAQRAR